MALLSTSSPLLSTSLHQLDKISRLPDDILLNIVSIFDFQTAVRTSILAKRWKYLWTWLTVLDFHPENLSPFNHHWYIDKLIEPQGYLNWVNQVIHAHSGPCITKFRVFFVKSWSKDISQIEKWVSFAVSKRVQELDLRFLFYDHSARFSLGFDILKHSIANLKSLSMSNVDISGETLESVLLHCDLLERLYVDESETLKTLNIVSYKLKHLTLIRCHNLIELEIDAVNLISFCYGESHRSTRLQMVFKRVPNLVELDFGVQDCLYPVCFLEKFSHLSKQLTKLSFCPFIDYRARYLHPRLEVNVVFPYVKQLTLTVMSFSSLLFITACPMLHELKLQVGYARRDLLKEEADQLQEIKLEDERNNEMSMDQKLERKEHKNNKSQVNLKVLEIVGFHGCNNDVVCALEIISRANSMERLICELRHLEEIIEGPGVYEDVDKAEKRSRAHKLAKLVPPRVHVGVRDKSGLSWIS